MIFIGIIPTLVIYGIIIARIKGRCSQYEYIINGLLSFCLVIISIILFALMIPIVSFFMMFVIFFALYNYVKFTIQRLYDLGLSGYYLLLTLIPLVGLIMTIILSIKKSKIEPNEYDEAIKYKKLIKDRKILNIFNDKIEFDDIEFKMEYYLGKYTIKISKYTEKNIFSDYLYKNYPSVKDNIYDLVEIDENDFPKIIDDLELVVLYKSQYIKIKEYILFIRFYNFKYDIIINKNDHKLTKDIIDTFNFPGAYFEDENYIYYNKITKDEIKEWIKNTT